MNVSIGDCSEGTPSAKFEFGSLDTKSVQDMGWLGRKNGELLELASVERFDVLVTIDKKLQYQLNLMNYQLAIVILNTYRNTLAHLKPLVPKVVAMLESAKPGEVYEITD